MTTFADLGMPFPLYAAPIGTAVDHAGEGTCSLCGALSAACFDLGTGGCEMRSCPECRSPVGSDDFSVDCEACRTPVAFPDRPEPVLACYACLRSGRATLMKDTELGLVTWEDLVRPERPRDGVHLTKAAVVELLRTPTYSTNQSERWLFCCDDAMVYVGEWSREEFGKWAPDGDGKAFFEAVVEKPIPALWAGELDGAAGIYVFHCKRCGRHRAHWDLD